MTTLRYEHLRLVTVVCNYGLLDGSIATGSVALTPSTVLIDASADRVIYPVPLSGLLVNGSISFQVPATDDAEISPTGWTYAVMERIDGVGGRVFNILVPSSYYLQNLPLPLATAAQIAASVGTDTGTTTPAPTSTAVDGGAAIPYGSDGGSASTSPTASLDGGGAP